VVILRNVQYVVSSWEVVSMDKKNAETRTKLKDISSVKEFGDLMEQTMLSDEEKKILWMYYKEKKTLQCIADEIGLSEIAVKKKHRKMLMKIGRMI
jgi:DNA-directed RNA polymerase specialized sigma subunit